MIKAIVTDIEGTTSSILFVKDVLFPYARANLADYVRSHADDPQVKPLLEDVCKEVGSELSTEQIITQLIQWIDEDKKVTPLKSLQGMIWEAGYRQGDFKGHLYPDAAANLKAWKAEGPGFIRLFFRLGLRAKTAVRAYRIRRFNAVIFRLLRYPYRRQERKRIVRQHSRTACHTGEPAVVFIGY